MEEGEKRKTDDVVPGARKRARGKEGVAAVDEVQTPPLDVGDAEVEEFFAILKRIRTAVKYFDKGGGGRSDDSGRKMTQPLERRECSAAAINGVTGEKKETETKKIGDIDLNMDPNPDDNSS